MNIKEIDNFLVLWDSNNLHDLGNSLDTLSHADLAFVVAWMTAMIRDESEVRLSQWLVWLETKSNNQ
jgi:hypothetical protein